MVGPAGAFTMKASMRAMTCTSFGDTEAQPRSDQPNASITISIAIGR